MNADSADSRDNAENTGNAEITGILSRAHVATGLPAQELDRARRFHSEKLGLDPVDERPGGLPYRCGGVDFAVFPSTGASPGTFTRMAWEVDGIERVASELRRRGVVFEDVELPRLLGGGGTRDGIAEVGGNYPSWGARGCTRRRLPGRRGERAGHRPTGPLSGGTGPVREGVFAHRNRLGLTPSQ
ncbi:hypothetical protein GCM10010211_43400 [Streptomyces albospinus]|uniref:VOC domain-containing protein n=1 Tax=Streptomyces albospinus TaxID=285515 RepID=A0ABQ2VAP1_9ACTN|nr:hypothetical protein GCM10010211_43400 [Streptomyces albospinus]